MLSESCTNLTSFETIKTKNYFFLKLYYFNFKIDSSSLYLNHKMNIVPKPETQNITLYFGILEKYKKQVFLYLKRRSEESINKYS